MKFKLNAALAAMVLGGAMTAAAPQPPPRPTPGRR